MVYDKRLFEVSLEFRFIINWLLCKYASTDSWIKACSKLYLLASSAVVISAERFISPYLESICTVNTP